MTVRESRLRYRRCIGRRLRRGLTHTAVVLRFVVLFLTDNPPDGGGTSSCTGGRSSRPKGRLGCRHGRYYPAEDTKGNSNSNSNNNDDKKQCKSSLPGEGTIQTCRGGRPGASTHAGNRSHLMSTLFRPPSSTVPLVPSTSAIYSTSAIIDTTTSYS
jgi:hypothetical protein